MDPGFPESTAGFSAIVRPTPIVAPGTPLDTADWKATFEGGPPINANLVFLLGPPTPGDILILYASKPDRIQYTSNPSRRITSDEGCVMESFDLFLDAG